MDTTCWNCGKLIQDISIPLSFREICPFCHAYLHVCKNCTNYQPGRANDCKIPGIDPISNREMRNSCDEFILLGKGSLPKADPKDVLKRLFGDD